jgi:hypothetical protein
VEPPTKPGTPVTTYYVSTWIYNGNTRLDADKDGIACEKARRKIHLRAPTRPEMGNEAVRPAT